MFGGDYLTIEVLNGKEAQRHESQYVGLNEDPMTLNEVCDIFAITEATGRNWARLGKLQQIPSNDGKLWFDRPQVEYILDQIQQGNIHALHSRRNKSQIRGLAAVRMIYYQRLQSNYVENMTEVLASPLTADELYRPACPRRRPINRRQRKSLSARNRSRSDVDCLFGGRLDLGYYADLIDDLLNLLSSDRPGLACRAIVR